MDHTCSFLMCLMSHLCSCSLWGLLATSAPIRVSDLRASTAEIYESWLKNKKGKGSDVVKPDMQQWFGTLILNGLLRVVSGKRLLLNKETLSVICSNKVPQSISQNLT